MIKLALERRGGFRWDCLKCGWISRCWGRNLANCHSHAMYHAKTCGKGSIWDVMQNPGDYRISRRDAPQT